MSDVTNILNINGNMIKQQKALFEDSSGWLLSKYFERGCAVTLCQYIVQAYMKLEHLEDYFSYLALVCLEYPETQYYDCIHIQEILP